MDNFLYFYHTTKLANFLNILKTGFLKTESCKKNIADQFPGIYMNAYMSGEAKETIDWTFGGDIAIVFPVDLIMKQSNWHFNLVDQNGNLNGNTYSKPTINLLPNITETKAFFGSSYRGNELIVHDDVDIRLASVIWVRPANEYREDIYKSLLKNLPKIKDLPPIKLAPSVIPKNQLYATNKQLKYFNELARPAMIYRLDFHYTGLPYNQYSTGKKKTSIQVYRKIAENCGFDVSELKNKTKYEIDELIKSRICHVFKKRPDVIHWPPFTKTSSKSLA